MGTRQRSIKTHMRILRLPQQLSNWCRTLHREGVTIGLVPTMGAFHEGHRSLIRAARLSCEAVVVSLFVNPRQFHPHEDLGRYPRNLRADAALCRREGVDVLFAPTEAFMYPQDFSTTVSVHNISRRWEGASRPAHFEGVATVVTKLLSLTRPDRTFLGQKDLQQAVLVERLVADLNLGTRVIIRPTVRDHDGLALSSRNAYLSPRLRRAAPVLFRALQAGQKAIQAGARQGARILQVMRSVIEQEPLAAVDYLALCDRNTLEPLASLTRSTRNAVLLGAIRIGGVRLIDNLPLSVHRRAKSS